MTINEFKDWIKTTEQSYRYQLLSRMQSDCKYFLGNGCGGSRLWGETIDKHIEYMKELYNLIDIKPEWLTMDEINQYEHDMKNIEEK